MHSMLIIYSIISFQKAIGNPLNEELQIKAWDGVLPLVNKLKRFYEFSLKLGLSQFCVLFLFSLNFQNKYHLKYHSK